MDVRIEARSEVAWLWLAFVEIAWVADLAVDLAPWKLWEDSWRQILWTLLLALYFIPWTLVFIGQFGIWILFDIRNRGGGWLMWRWWFGGLVASLVLGTGPIVFGELIAPGTPLDFGFRPEFLVGPAVAPAIWVLTARPRELRYS